MGFHRLRYRIGVGVFREESMFSQQGVTSVLCSSVVLTQLSIVFAFAGS